MILVAEKHSSGGVRHFDGVAVGRGARFSGGDGNPTVPTRRPAAFTKLPRRHVRGVGKTRRPSFTSPLLVVGIAVSLLHPSTSAVVDRSSIDGFDASYSDVQQAVSPAVVSVFFYIVLLMTLELNDFRNALKKSFRWNDRRLVAGMVAVRLGFRDAAIDWFIMYAACYGVVYGLTKDHMEPKSLAMFNGFGWFVSMILMALLSGKLPQWIALYRRRSFQFSGDTSGRSATVDADGTTLSQLRMQVRLGVGQQLAAFAIVILPYFSALRIWSYVLSAFIGAILGYAFMYGIYSARCDWAKTDKARFYVCACAVSVVCVLSALSGLLGVRYIHTVWNQTYALSAGEVYSLFFFVWLAILGVYHTFEYRSHLRIERDREQAWLRLFDDGEVFVVSDAKNNRGAVETVNEKSEVTEGDTVTVSVVKSVKEGEEEDQPDAQDQSASKQGQMIYRMPQISSGIGRGGRRGRGSIWYQTGFFDPKVLLGEELEKQIREEEDGTRAKERDTFVDNSGEEGNESDTPKECSADQPMVEDSPYELYKLHAKLQGDDKSWSKTLWNHLPFIALWAIFLDKSRKCWCCSEFKNSSTGQKWASSIGMIFKSFANLVSLFLVLVACVATQQIKTTKFWLPAVNEAIYKYIDEGPVCAFEVKDGDYRTFDSKESADESNYTISHCGACGHCSSWIDLELEYSTRDNLAARAQKCGVKTLGKPIGALQECLMDPDEIGWSEDCALCWAEDMVCTKKHCMFIFIQSFLTNQVANFAVGPNDITTASCEEAMCEKDPHQFVPCSGATRRRMNVTSSIQRLGAQRCSIVGVESWEEFFYP